MNLRIPDEYGFVTKGAAFRALAPRREPPPANPPPIPFAPIQTHSDPQPADTRSHREREREARDKARVEAFLAEKLLAGRIIAAACERFGVTYPQFMGRARTSRVTCARWAAWVVMTDAGLSAAAAARFSAKNHNAVLNALARVDRAGAPIRALRAALRLEG